METSNSADQIPIACYVSAFTPTRAKPVERQSLCWSKPWI